MSTSLRSFYHAVAAANSLKDWPLGGALLDEPIVVVRMDGGVTAMRDVCAHMDAALSGGWVMRGQSGDELVCPHHRWRYNAAGRCTHIPELGAEQAVPDWAAVPRFSVLEKYGLVWVCLEEPAGAGLPEVAELENDGYARFGVRPRAWKQPAHIVIEKFIDAAPAAIGPGEARLFPSLTALQWSVGRELTVLFAISPINRTACRSFWVGARQLDRSTPESLAALDEEAYARIEQALAV